MALPDCTEEELQALYEWVDSVPLSRPKKSIARDFADGGATNENRRRAPRVRDRAWDRR